MPDQDLGMGKSSFQAAFFMIKLRVIKFADIKKPA